MPDNYIPNEKSYSSIMQMKNVPSPILQSFNAVGSGVYLSTIVNRPQMMFEDLQKHDSESRYPDEKHLGLDYDDIEKRLWKSITRRCPLYGANIDDTLTDVHAPFNLNKLNCMLELLRTEYQSEFPGILTSYTYVGTFGSSFCYHIEDMNLFSFNFMHYGEPKMWFIIPPHDAKPFEAMAKEALPTDFVDCPAFLRHKNIMFHADKIRQSGITCNRVIQSAKEMLVLLPNVYHAGFNCGFNIAEAVNYATIKWVDFGKHAEQCVCRK